MKALLAGAMYLAACSSGDRSPSAAPETSVLPGSTCEGLVSSVDAARFDIQLASPVPQAQVIMQLGVRASTAAQCPSPVAIWASGSLSAMTSYGPFEDGAIVVREADRVYIRQTIEISSEADLFSVGVHVDGCGLETAQVRLDTLGDGTGSFVANCIGPGLGTGS